MAIHMNIFRILGDISHTLSKVILIIAIHRNKSAEGVSLITQALYCLVFITRYLDLFRPIGAWSWWNFDLKVFYILSSLYILFIMLMVYARTREREKAWKFGGAVLFGSAVVAPFVMLIGKKKDLWSIMELLWIFSIILESLCVLPQLLLLRQTTVPTVLDSYYLLTLGSYRAFYILNWIYREADPSDRKPDLVSIIFGVIQTAFYADFAWVYYSRQRVKLRNGGVVDADDIGRGWLLSKVLGNRAMGGNVDNDEDGDEESTPSLGRDRADDQPGGASRTGGKTKWGARGISVQADDSVLSMERERQNGLAGKQHSGIATAHAGDEDAKMRDPDELARILDDEDDGSDDGILPAAEGSGVSNGSEWREGRN